MLLFSVPKPVIGMIHLPGLPGSPRCSMTIGGIRDWALREAEALVAGGVDGLMVENFGDAPFFPGRVPVHTVANMTVIAQSVKSSFRLPLGINTLRNDGVGSVAVAAAVGAEFIRVNVYTGARVTDQGIVQGQAHRILRMRQILNAQCRIFADVAVKHSSPLGVRRMEDEVADTVLRGGADAVIVSGSVTGAPASIDDLRIARQSASGVPVFVGSGAGKSDLAEVLRYADGLIVGTGFKRDGVVTNPVVSERVKAFMENIAAFRA